MTKVGIIGLSDGNGHPYSFSAIINGYDDYHMENGGWKNIHQYLRERDISDFGILDAKVTHVWTQDMKESTKIANATKIENIVNDFNEMIEHVDAVIIARDDFESHRYLAQPFLESGKHVFIDKPLSLSLDDLIYFKPFLLSGQLFSCSGMRYSPELDTLRKEIKNFGEIKLIRGTTVKSWDKYAIHMLDAIFSVVPFDVKSVQYIKSNHESFLLYNFDGSVIQVDALGKSDLVLRVEFFGDLRYCKADTLNAFDAFRRMLWSFVYVIKNKVSLENNSLTINLMKVLIAGNMSKKTNSIIELNSLEV